ncbi:ABC transporter ATP-binding protein [uncultured Anaerococcus sp.]|uniref:ABC transporter ATP-binding protein n=1 Tax=uncultured Anaerococcus sp. TaxID=293428 RepID=UPI0025F7A221|nr:ABC transporter ATP-binding protein [uncultured Anaerococcus sp.]
MAFIEVKNLKKAYGKNIVIPDLSCEMQEGTLNTLLGASGSGKSTLLRSMAGLEDIQGGEIYIDGVNVTNLPTKDRNVGMVFQNYALFPNLTVLDNVAFGLDIRGDDKEQARQKCREMIKRVGLSGKEDAYPENLSGGQQQRVALARSLVTEPKALFLDEPLSALDAKIRVELRELIKELQEELKITVILVTHDQEEAMIMSEKIFVMENGQIVQEGSPIEVYESPRTNFVAGFVGNHNLLTSDEFEKISGDHIETKGLIAIRPETIMTKIYDTESPYYEFDARVLRSSMNGSIIRYYLDVNGINIVADQLNKQSNLVEDGTEMKIYLYKDELILVGKTIARDVKKQ